MTKQTKFGILLIFFSIFSIFGIEGCGSNPTTEACLINGDPECSNLPGNPGVGGNDAGGSGGNDSGGAGGDSGTGGNGCTSNPNFGKVCTTLDGHNGHFHCIDDKLSCLPDGGGGTGGDAGGGAGGDGGGIYHCATDPKKGTSCPVNTGVCFNTGIFLCYNDTEAPKCNALPLPANPAGEICGNGKDDDCDGVVDELSCSGGGDGGGGGGGDGGGGSGGSGGGATCTSAPSITATFLAPVSLTSLLKGAGSVDASNPLIKGLVNGNALALNASGGISVSINTGKINVFRANSPGGDPTPLLDVLYCRQIGIDPPTPASCNMGVIGSRSSAAYLSALNVDFTCWRSGGVSCPVTIAGKYPGDLFVLVKVVQNGDSLSQSPFPDAYSGVQHFLTAEMPALCP